MCMFCGVADPTHEQALATAAALVLGWAGGLLMPWHVLEAPVRKAGEVLGRKPRSLSLDETGETNEAAATPPAQPAPPA